MSKVTTVYYGIDFEKGRTGHGISDLPYFGPVYYNDCSALPRHMTYDPNNLF
jgi:hypothetical protein